MRVSVERRNRWADELQLEWVESSEEDFQGKLVAKFRENLAAGYSSHEIIHWFEAVPSAYWKSIETEDLHKVPRRRCLSYYGDDNYRQIKAFDVFAHAEQVVDFILTAGETSQANESLKTAALHFSVASGRIYLTEQIFAKHGADVNAIDSWGWNTMCFALAAANLRMTELLLLLGHGASWDFSQAKMFCPFFQAILRKQLKLFNLALGLEISSTVHCTGMDDILMNGKTCLQVAADQGRKDIMLTLLEHGVDPRTLCLRGNDLFHYVFKITNKVQIKKINDNSDEHTNFIKWFLALKKYPIKFKAIEDRRRNYMWKLLNYEDEEIFRLLIQNYGLDFSKCSPNFNSQTLHFAVFTDNYFKVFKSILKEFRQGHNFFCSNLPPNGILHDAVFYGTFNAIKWLLKRGFDINRRIDRPWYEPENTRKVVAPLHYAILIRDLRIIYFLLLRGAEVNDKTSLLEDVFAHINPNQWERQVIIDLLVKFITLSEFLKEPLDDDNSWCTQFTQDTRDFHESCQSELSLMKNHFIYGSVSFFSLLNNVKRFSRCPCVIEALADEDNRERYPLYFHILSDRFSLVRKRPELEMKAVSSLQKIMRLPANAFPTIFDNIFANLGSKDLRILSLV